MSRSILALGICAALVTGAAAAGAGHDNVLGYHGGPDRRGNFIVPALTHERARGLHLDQDFRAEVSGHVYAQPLYWQPPGSAPAMLVVATESDTVHALDAHSGSEIWKRSLGNPVPRSSLPCGNVDPLGVTGTPVIDEASNAVYLDAMVQGSSGPRHLVFGLSLKDGSLLPGWPIDIEEALKGTGPAFMAPYQNQRGALAILAGSLYVPFGGHFGDCGDYHGFVVGISLSNPSQLRSFATRARGGGIWAPGGIASDGRSLFAATGNTFGAAEFSDGEAVLRLAPDLHRPAGKQDVFAPADWRSLDARDADLGTTHPLPLDLESPSGPQALILEIGKTGMAYLLDRDELGGIGGALAADRVASGITITAPAAFPAPDGALVAFQGTGAHCPAGAAGSGLTVLKIRPGSPPGLETAWCASLRGRGSPIVTTTDGRADPIVWALGAEGDGLLHGFRGDTGEPLFNGASEPMRGLRRFQTPIATSDRLYVAADGKIYAFAF
jgi:outer membrane protein assembly factor BamB